MSYVLELVRQRAIALVEFEKECKANPPKGKKYAGMKFVDGFEAFSLVPEPVWEDI